MNTTTRRDHFIAVAGTLLVVASLLFLVRNNGIIRNVSAVQSGNVGVYWDAGCTQLVTSIDWGNLFPGTSKKINVYVRNEWNNTANCIYVIDGNWNPASAPKSIEFSWNYTKKPMTQNTVALFSLMLNISKAVAGISVFSYNMAFYATDTKFPPWDVNQDGYVNGKDASIFGTHMGSQRGQPNYLAAADINDDGFVNGADAAILGAHFGNVCG